MNKQMRPLTHLALHTAMLDRTPVVVFLGKELIGHGIISRVTADSIKVDNEYYMRANVAVWTDDPRHV
jgi:hypothetical protein